MKENLKFYTRMTQNIKNRVENRRFDSVFDSNLQLLAFFRRKF